MILDKGMAWFIWVAVCIFANHNTVYEDIPISVQWDYKPV